MTPKILNPVTERENVAILGAFTAIVERLRWPAHYDKETLNLTIEVPLCKMADVPKGLPMPMPIHPVMLVDDFDGRAVFFRSISEMIVAYDRTVYWSKVTLMSDYIVTLHFDHKDHEFAAKTLTAARMMALTAVLEREVPRIILP